MKLIFGCFGLLVLGLTVCGILVLAWAWFWGHVQFVWSLIS